MFKTISEVRKANKEAGQHFFDADAMRFFASAVESQLYKNQTFITSEKRCFEDYTRVYSVRLAKPNASIETLFNNLESLSEARSLARNFKGEGVE